MNHNSIVNEIATAENLILAWRKVEQSFHHGDVWFDEIEISKFKFELIENIKRISEQILKKTYKLKPIYPAPFPKGNDKDGNKQVRQSFYINVEDQVVWMAVINIIGKKFETQMPAWSYGNRLNVAVWKEKGKWTFGDINNSSTRFYRKWNQSWPLYRKQLLVSIKKMAYESFDKKSKLADDELDIINENNSINDKHKYLKLRYLENNYFSKSEKNNRNLYWAGIDLEKFYQKVNINNIETIICKSYKNDEDFCWLIKQLTKFKINKLNYSKEELKYIQLDQKFSGLPTGLIVAGFLANVFFLETDKKIEEKLDRNRNIIHFRYVDDHIFVATSPQILYNWIIEYNRLIKDKGLNINLKKIEPEGIRPLFIEENETIELTIKEKIEKNASLDVSYPSPLMTETLQKISELSDICLDLLSDSEFEMVFKDLQMLMVTDIPEQEIKKNTRISFACSMLTRMITNYDCNLEEIYKLRKEWIERVNDYVKKFSEDERKKKEKRISSMYQIAFSNGIIEDKDINDLKKQCRGIRDLNIKTIENLKETIASNKLASVQRKKKIYKLLEKAIIEVPEKSRIWIRAFDFCTYNSPEYIKNVYNLLHQLHDEEILHNLGCEYLFAMIHVRMAYNIFRAINRLLEDNYSNPTQKEIDKSYLNEVTKINIYDNNNHYMVRNSISILNKAKQLYVDFQEQLGLNNIRVQGKFTDAIYYNNEKLPFNFWMLWGMEKINSKNPVIHQKFKNIFRNHIKNINPTDKFFLPLICRCLSDLKEADYNQIHFDHSFKLPKNFNHFEFFYNLKNLPEAQNFGYHFTGYEKFIEFKCNNNDDKEVNLVKWIDYINIENHVSKLDIRYSEFLATKITYAITNEALNMLPIKKNFKLHPLSIIINTDDGKITEIKNWQDWIYQNIKIKIKQNRYIDDSIYRYTQNILNGTPKNEDSMVYAIGMIFLQLLTKQKNLPWIIYRPEFGFEWEPILNNIMRSGEISSKNYEIIHTCLSAKNRELLRIMKQDENSPCFRPTDKEPYKGLQDLSKDLKESIDSMMLNMVSVSNNETRQLTVIDLK